MDYKSATNPDTGDKVFLVDNKWVKPSKSATNPDTGDKAYLINNKWHEVAAPADTKENAPQASMRDESNQPDAKKGNWFTDITAGLASGAGNVLSAPTNISDILAGKKPYEAKGTPEALAKAAGMPLNAEDAYKGILNALTPGKISSLEDIHTKLSGLAGNVLQPKAAQELGGELLAAGESTKSTELKELERQRSENISKETSLLGEGKAAMGSTLANPSMLPNFIAEQIPNLVLPIGAGKLAIGTAKSLFTAATEKTLSRIGVSAAVATGAAQQAGDTGGDTYEAVHSHLIEQGMPEEEAHKIAIEKAKVAAGKAGAISIATGFIPGANALERQLIGKAETEIAKKGIAKYVSTGLNVAGEATQEGIEEGGGKYVSNVGLQQVAPETNVMKGVGGAAGLGALGGGIFGGLTHTGGHTPTTGAATTADAKWEFDENGNLVPKKAETQVAPTGQAAQVLPPEQLNLDLQGGNAPTPKTPFQLAGGPGKYEAMAAAKNVVDPQKILELRNQYDTLEQELNRLQKTFETETDPAKQEAIKVQAQKLDFARQEVESQLKAIKNIPPRTAAQGTQRTLDLEPHTPPPIATNAQESLFAPEEIPPKIDQSVLNESEKKASEIERNIFALQQGPQTTKTKNQIAALQSQLETEQANIEKIDAQEEMKLVVPKPISPIVGNVMSKFGIAPKAPIRNEIKNLDMTDPEDRAAFVAAVDKHTMKHAKINMEEVEKYLNNFEGKPNERATAGGEGVSGDVTGGPESSNAMPVQETATPQGTALPIAGGMGSNIGDTGGVTGGEEVPSTTQQGTLGAPTQAPTAIPPIPAPPVTQQATTQPTAIPPVATPKTKTEVEELQNKIVTTNEAAKEAFKNGNMEDFVRLRKESEALGEEQKTALEQARSLFGNEGGEDTALLRSGFTPEDIAKALGMIKGKLPANSKIDRWEQAYEEAGGKKSMPNVGRVEQTINQIKNLKKSYDSNEDVSGTFLKALTDITSTANLFSFDRGYSNRIRAAMIALKDKGDITLDQFKQGLLRTSISQALHRKDLARKFLSMGDLIYSKATNRWSAVNDEINWGNFESLVKKFATDIGGTPEQALKYMSKAYEANRVLDDYKLMDKLAKDVNDTRAEVDVLSKNKSRNAAEERALNKKRDLLKEFTKQYQHQVDLVQHMTRAQAQAGVKNMLDMHPAIKQGMDIINTIKQRAVKIMVDTGVKNEDAAKDWINDLSYVPFSREIDDAKNGGAILSRNLKEVMKERHKEGSMREVKNTIENMYDWYQWAISRAISNQQMNVMVDQYKAVLPDEVKKGRGQRGNTFSVWKNGMEEFYNVSDPTIAQAFLGMESMVFPGIGVWMQFKNAFSHLVTRMPAFPLVQLFSDTYDAMTTSGLRHPFGLLKEVGKEIVKTAKGTSEARRIMSAAGVLMTHDANALTSADDLTKKMNLDDPSAYRKTMNALDKWAAVNDNIVRQAVYSQGIKENLSHSMAMEKAVELVNFRRISGNPAIVFASKVIPFFGAYMQVADVALKTITGKGITPQERKEGLKIFVATTAKLAALSFLYSAAVGDDDDYKNKTRISRDQSFVIPGTGGLSIPVRPGFFSINKLIGEYGYKYLAENSTDAPEEFVKAMSHAVLKQFSPPSTTLVTPALGLYLNKDIYNNRDIANPTMRKLLPEDQYNKYTSEMSKVLAEATGISALKIDYFLTSYFSSVASLTALATNALIADMRGVPLPTMSTRDKIASLPNVSKFISKEETSDAIADFYDTTKDISTLVDTLNSLGQYSPEKAQKLMEKPENIKLLKGADKTENAKAVLAKLNAEERYIREQPANKMSGDKKAEKLKELNAYREKIREVTKQIKQSIE